MVTSVQILNGPIINEGESLSEGIDCSAGKIVRITMPDGWDTASLTFQISTNGEFYNDLYLANGQEYTVAAAKQRAIIIPQQEWIPGLWVKIRSGTGMQPVKQTAYREFSMVLLIDGEAPVEEPPITRTEIPLERKSPKQKPARS